MPQDINGNDFNIICAQDMFNHLYDQAINECATIFIQGVRTDKVLEKLDAMKHIFDVVFEDCENIWIAEDL
jgi:hypothetical protein